MPLYRPYTPQKKRHISWKLILLFLLLVLIGLVELFFIIWRLDHPRSKSANAPDSSNSTSVQSFDKNKYSINEATSLWVVVNKGRVLLSTYAPANLVVPDVSLYYGSSSNDSHLRKDAAAALGALFAVAKGQGYNLKLFSGYRSYGEQASVYGGFVKSQGQSYADTSSARAGYSEHQTGLAADISTTKGICELEQCFGNVPEGQWLAANSYKYGFIVRYQKGKENLTGYEYEPWHLRYVGTDLATEIRKSDLTLEQFFGLPTYSDYTAQSYLLK